MRSPVAQEMSLSEGDGKKLLVLGSGLQECRFELLSESRGCEDFHIWAVFQNIAQELPVIAVRDLEHVAARFVPRRFLLRVPCLCSDPARRNR